MTDSTIFLNSKYVHCKCCYYPPTVCFKSSILKFNPPYFLSIRGMENRFCLSLSFPLTSLAAVTALCFPSGSCKTLTMSSASLCVESVSHAHSGHRTPADTFHPSWAVPEDYISQLLAAISWYGIYLLKTGCHFWPRRVRMCCRNCMLPMELPDYSQACTCAVVYCCQNVKSCIRAALVQFFYHLFLWLEKFVLNSCCVVYPQPALHLSLAPAQY